MQLILSTANSGQFRLSFEIQTVGLTFRDNVDPLVQPRIGISKLVVLEDRELVHGRHGAHDVVPDLLLEQGGFETLQELTGDEDWYTVDRYLARELLSWTLKLLEGKSDSPVENGWRDAHGSPDAVILVVVARATFARATRRTRPPLS